jgi:hypothetical protein
MVTLEQLKETIPHGSGIDCDWAFEEKGNFIYAYNSYHCMNEFGYYDGYCNFELKIPKNSPIDFKLRFVNNDGYSWYRIKKYMLRDYLDGLFADYFNEIGDKNE